MKCRQCGTEIAEKALICYRCGIATTEAKYAPVPIQSPAARTSVALAIALAILVVLGAYLGVTGVTDGTRTVGWSVAVSTAVLLAVRVRRRRRR